MRRAWPGASFLHQMAAEKKVDHGVLYDPMTMTQRDFKRQIQVPNATRQLIIDLAVGGAKATQQDLVVSGTYVYQCVAQLIGNPIVNSTSLMLQYIRGMLSIPNVVAARNDKLEYIVNGIVHQLTLPQGFYSLTSFAGALATNIAAGSGIACAAGAIDAARGTFTLTMAIGSTLQFNTNGVMARFPRFASFPLGPAAQTQTITGAWLFYTRSITVVVPELTRMLGNPCLGNVAQFSPALTVLYINNPTAPVFFDIASAPGALVLPLQYDERVSALTITLMDEYGEQLAAYCSSVGDWFTMVFAVAR